MFNRTVADALNEFFNKAATGIKALLNLKADKTDVNNALNTKTDISTFNSTVTNLNNAINSKATLADVYTKTQTYSQAEVNGAINSLSTDLTNKINLKANSADVTSAFNNVTNVLNTKANSADVNSALSTKADTSTVNSAFTNLTNSVNAKANSADVYNKSEVNSALNTKANSADMTTALNNKVDKVSGKVLSTNDFTAAHKTKLEGLQVTLTGEVTGSGTFNNAGLLSLACSVEPSAVLESVNVSDTTEPYITNNKLDFAKLQSPGLFRLTGTTENWTNYPQGISGACYMFVVSRKTNTSGTISCFQFLMATALDKLYYRAGLNVSMSDTSNFKDWKLLEGETVANVRN